MKSLVLRTCILYKWVVTVNLNLQGTQAFFMYYSCVLTTGRSVCFIHRFFSKVELFAPTGYTRYTGLLGTENEYAVKMI